MTRNDSGATAILVGLMATVLIGMMAFTADFGMAYANKRQLQTAADAAALGAAGVFASSQKFACDEVLTDKSGAANTEATTKVTQNAPRSGTAALTTYTRNCTAKGIEVAVTVTGTSPNFFGKILGKTDDYQVGRTATAIVETSTGASSGVRPIAICSSDLPPTMTSGTSFLLELPRDGQGATLGCPIPPNSGNWWTLDCPEELADKGAFQDDGTKANGQGNSALVDQILNGCRAPVTIVPNQGDASGNTLNNILQTACPSASSTAPFMCLSGDPGQPDSGQVEGSWRALIDARKESLIPVFCARLLCERSSVTGTGTNAIFPVHKFIGVTVCGYHFGRQNNKKYRAALSGSTDLCYPAASRLTDLQNDDVDTRNYLVLVLRNVQTSGSTVPSTCKFANTTCDTGVRQVRLVK